MLEPQPATPIRDAATVLLLREVQQELEVLMLRRHQNLSFMADRWAFPGGGLSKHDRDPRVLDRLRGVRDQELARLWDRHLQPVSREVAQGLLVTACRETFEEVGVLIACDADGKPCSADVVSRLQTERSAIDHDASLFLPMLARENLYLDANALMYWSHWITPSDAGPRRYDTRFFLIAMPDDQHVTLSSESSEFAWMKPHLLIEAADRGEMQIPGPTLSNLQELDECYRACGSIDAVLARECSRAVPPILPKVAKTDHGMIVIMPWDADYANVPGDGITVQIEYSEFLRTRAARRIRR